MVNGLGKYYENDDNGNVIIAKQSSCNCNVQHAQRYRLGPYFTCWRNRVELHHVQREGNEEEE